MEVQDLRVQGIVYRPLVWTADGRPHPVWSREPCNMQQTPHAAMDNKYRQPPSNTGGNMRFKLPCFDEEQ